MENDTGQDDLTVGKEIDRGVGMSFRLSGFKATIVQYFDRHLMELQGKIAEFIDQIDIDKIIAEAIEIEVAKYVREEVQRQAKTIAEQEVALKFASLQQEVERRVANDIADYARWRKVQQYGENPEKVVEPQEQENDA